MDALGENYPVHEETFCLSRGGPLKRIPPLATAKGTDWKGFNRLSIHNLHAVDGLERDATGG